jgi:hypothetical protein
MVIENRITLILSEFHTTLFQNTHRPSRVVTTTHLSSIEASLAKVMTQGNKDNTLSRDSYRFVLEHTVKKLK